MKKEKLFILRSLILIILIYFSLILCCFYTDICSNPFFPIPILFGIGTWLYLEFEALEKIGIFWGLVGFFGTWGYIELILYLLGKSPIF